MCAVEGFRVRGLGYREIYTLIDPESNTLVTHNPKTLNRSATLQSPVLQLQ